MYDRLMVAFDGTEHSRRALQAGIELARRLEIPLWTITILEDSAIAVAAASATTDVMVEHRLASDSLATELQQEVYARGHAAGVEIAYEAVYGSEVDGIVDAVRRYEIDTLIVGLREHPGLIDRLVSHTARDLSERSPCNVLGVK